MKLFGGEEQELGPDIAISSWVMSGMRETSWLPDNILDVSNFLLGVKFVKQVLAYPSWSSFISPPVENVACINLCFLMARFLAHSLTKLKIRLLLKPFIQFSFKLSLFI